MSVAGQRPEKDPGKKDPRKTQERMGSMPEPAEDVIVRNLIEALERLQEDLDRVELWTSALGQFHSPVPDYRPGHDQHLLPQPNHSSPNVEGARIHARFGRENAGT